jgi:peptide/nickel transport system permease protein
MPGDSADGTAATDGVGSEDEGTRPTADGGSAPGETFETVAWEDIDRNRARARGEAAWLLVAAPWLVGLVLVGVPWLGRVVAGSRTGPPALPVFGVVGPLPWLLSGLVLGGVYHRLRPLRRSRVAALWLGFAGAWLVAVSMTAYTQLVAQSGPAAFPVLGTVPPVDWLWLLTVAVIVRYGVVPLWRAPRIARYYWQQFRRNTAAVVSAAYLAVVFVVGIVGARVVPEPTPTPGLESQPPAFVSVPSYVTGVDCPGGTRMEAGTEVCRGSLAHPLGTTGSGEDLLRAVIHGMEVSMQVGLIATLISIALATAVGLAAAYYGGYVDEVLMRYVDIQQTFPTLFLFLLLAYSLGGSLFLLVLIFGFFGWGNSARLVRGEALQRREELYVRASKAAGASPFWTIRHHLLPNVSNSVITAATLSIPVIIIAEATFSFIGLADPTIPSWGRVISEGQGQLRDAWWISTIPGIFLFCTVLAFNFVGDALRDALDPRHGGDEQ